MQEIEKPSYYAIIPADVRYSQDLPPNAKLLYGEITCLCAKEGYCWASNGYFAKLYEVDRSTVSRWITALERMGKVKTRVIYKNDGKTVDKRTITLSDCAIPIGKNEPTPLCKNEDRGGGKKVKVNTTRVNTTSNNTIPTESKSKQLPKELVEEYYLPAYESYPGNKSEYWQTYHCFTKGCNKSKLIPLEEIKLLAPAIEKEIIHRAKAKKLDVFMSNWKTFSGWLTTASWRGELAELPDDKYYPSEAEIEEFKEMFRKSRENQ